MADGNDRIIEIPAVHISGIDHRKPRENHLSAKETAALSAELDKLLEDPKAGRVMSPGEKALAAALDKEVNKTLAGLSGPAATAGVIMPGVDDAMVARLDAARNDPTKPGSLLDLADPSIRPFDGGVSRVASFAKAAEYRTVSLTAPEVKQSPEAPKAKITPPVPRGS